MFANDAESIFLPSKNIKYINNWSIDAIQWEEESWYWMKLQFRSFQWNEKKKWNEMLKIVFNLT